MAEALKNHVGPQAVRELGDCLLSAYPTFNHTRFIRDAMRGLEALELKARVAHVARALEPCLPAKFPQAAAVIKKAMAPGSEHAAAMSSVFHFWPLCDYVQSRGLEHFDEAMAVMRVLTSRFSCEFAIRPYIEQNPTRTLSLLKKWCKDPDEHIRRLVSEGTRPRLPWGQQLKSLIADPSPALPLLDALYNDEELYVRRSVANHLNDISKDHANFAVEIAERWQAENSNKNTEWVIRHALRGLVKQGHPGALALQGFRAPRVESVSLQLSPTHIGLGQQITLNLKLTSNKKQSLIIDYAVHHQKANGKLSAKVFKWNRVELSKGQTLELNKTHSIRPISTRRYHPGLHKVEILINGQGFGVREFQLDV